MGGGGGGGGGVGGVVCQVLKYWSPADHDQNTAQNIRAVQQNLSRWQVWVLNGNALAFGSAASFSPRGKQ